MIFVAGTIGVRVLRGGFLSLSSDPADACFLQPAGFVRFAGQTNKALPGGEGFVYSILTV